MAKPHIWYHIFILVVLVLFRGTSYEAARRQKHCVVADIPCECTTRPILHTDKQKVVANPRSKVYRGEREFGERRQATSEAGKMRIKIAPGGQYLSISGAEVVPMLKKAAEKYGRYHSNARSPGVVPLPSLLCTSMLSAYNSIRIRIRIRPGHCASSGTTRGEERASVTG